MSFSAGGSNVRGVQQVEQGELQLSVTATNFSVAGGETLNVDLTVPAGKKWIIKSYSLATASFVGTLTSTAAQVLIGGNSISLGIGTTGLSYNQSQVLILSAGQASRFRFVTSAWTSGQLNCLLLYQELDA